MKKVIIAALLIVFNSYAGFAQTVDSVKLNKYMVSLESANKFMGSVAIARDGRVIYSKAVGFKDVSGNQRADTETKYRIGSISKTFTATLILKAVEEKRVSLSQTLSAYYPSIKNADKITIAQLLNHQSGVPNFTNSPSYLDWHTTKKTEQEMLKLISDLGSDFSPGTQAVYSNSAYVLLSFVLQKLYKMSYDKILDQKIVKPLGLKNTSFGHQISIANNESYSYEWKNERWVKALETDMSIPLGAGAIISTPSDLTVFASALFNGKLLTAESLKQMQTIEKNYGFGLVPVPFYEKMGYGHGGGIDGFRSFLVYFADGKVAVSFTSNGSAYDNNNITIALLSSVYGVSFEVPDFTSVDKNIDLYPGVYAKEGFPLKITITKSGNSLTGQATGQPAFPLEAKGNGVYAFDSAGISLSFNPDLKQMTLKQGGTEYVLTKE